MLRIQMPNCVPFFIVLATRHIATRQAVFDPAAPICTISLEDILLPGTRHCCHGGSSFGFDRVVPARIRSVVGPVPECVRRRYTACAPTNAIGNSCWGATQPVIRESQATSLWFSTMLTPALLLHDLGSGRSCLQG
ncbi:hypothetical protein MTO96_016138 [Rhipicephalus appendiculatus]